MRVKVYQCWNDHIVLMAENSSMPGYNQNVGDCMICKYTSFGDQVPMIYKGTFVLMSDHFMTSGSPEIGQKA